jgi:ketosteroid isomerase-like protein
MLVLNGVVAGMLAVAPALSEGAITDAARAEIVQTLTALEKQWIDVYVNHELSVLERLIADDFVATLSDGAVRGKREHIAAYPADFALYAAVVNSDVKVHVFAPNVAVATGFYAATLRKPEGAEPPGRYRWTDTWVLRKGVWQCVATQEARVP